MGGLVPGSHRIAVLAPGTLASPEPVALFNAGWWQWPYSRSPRPGGQPQAMLKPRINEPCVTVYGMSWPTTNDPRTEFITLRLTVSEAAELDAHVSACGFKSRSAASRDAIARVIAAEKKRRARQKSGETGGG